MATYQSYTPSSPLAAYVDSFWLHEDNAQPHAQERALPSAAPALWIDLGGDGLRVAAQRQPSRMRTFCASVALGAYSQWHLVEAGRHIARLGVKFKPGGAGAFFSPPAWELCDTQEPLEALWGDAAADELHERLLAETTSTARFQLLERTLLAHRASSREQHPAVTFALDALCATPHERTITQVVEQIALSHRQFIAVFRRDVGMTPKRFCRVRRFLAIIHAAQHTNNINWAAMALACGYADQAHLTREFHEFAGVSPTVYMRERDKDNPLYLPYAHSATCDTAAHRQPAVGHTSTESLAALTSGHSALTA